MITTVQSLLFNRFSLHSRVVSACIAMVVATSPSLAATAEQRAACAPDVFRLCSSDILNVERIVACMKRERSKLSPACAAVFRPQTVQASANGSCSHKIPISALTPITTREADIVDVRCGQ